MRPGRSAPTPPATSEKSRLQPTFLPMRATMRRSLVGRPRVMNNELRGNAALNSSAFSAWVATRHQQIEAAELIYIAKQLDLFGRAPGLNREV